MVRRFLIPLNSEYASSIDLRSDVRIPRPPGEDVCCEYSKSVVWVSLPRVGVVHMNVNHCLICGKELRR